jgi:hypothetical protein
MPSPRAPRSSNHAHRKPKNIVPARNATVYIARFRNEYTNVSSLKIVV